MYIMGRIYDLSALLVSSLPIECARRINRYCNAAQVVMYAGLSEHLQEGKIDSEPMSRLCLIDRDGIIRYDRGGDLPRKDWFVF